MIIAVCLWGFHAPNFVHARTVAILVYLMLKQKKLEIRILAEKMTKKRTSKKKSHSNNFKQFLDVSYFIEDNI